MYSDSACVCDSVNDCQDGSDEQNCGCTSNQFACSDGNQCIESWKRCDQRQDCRLDCKWGELHQGLLYRWTEHLADFHFLNFHWGRETRPPNYAPGVDFLDHNFLSSKNSG